MRSDTLYSTVKKCCSDYITCHFVQKNYKFIFHTANNYFQFKDDDSPTEYIEIKNYERGYYVL